MKNNNIIMSPFLLFISLLAICSTPCTAGSCNKDDKKALISIQKSLGLPSDPNPDCCTWFGVDCRTNNGNLTDRVQQFAIFRIDTLPGPISPAFGDLSELTSLDVRKLPNLTGPIPPALAKLKKLTSLRLDWNSLSGPVPDFLSQLTSLDYINLSFNKFSGSIPASLATLPLSFIRLDRNRLTGTIPPELAESRTQYLYLSHNNLSGSIPTTFSNVVFEVVDLSRNNLTGDASMLFGENKKLQTLDLSRNGFEFDMSSVKLPKDMVALVIDHNKIFGSLPTNFGSFKWQSLNVSYNRLCGQIPGGERIQSRFITKYEFFHNKCLCGPPLLTPCR